MLTDAELLARIKALAESGHYVIRDHATQHMFAEGFSINDTIAALTGKIHILERYPHMARCLVIGYFQLSDAVRMPLHIVVEHADPNEIEIITAYIPQKPWWTTPWQRGKKK